MLNAHKTFNWLFFISLYMLSTIALSSPEFETQLKQADSLRSANPKKFAELLRLLDSNATGATADQLEQLKYLQAYRLAYVGQYNLAIHKASAIFEQSKTVELKYRSGLLVTNSYAATRDFGSGLNFLDKTLALQNQISDPELRHDGLNVAAVLYNQLGQHTVALHYTNQILSDKPTPRAACQAGYLKLEALLSTNALPVENAPIEDVIKQCSELKEAVVANLTRGYLARKLAAQGDKENAIALLTDNLVEIEATGYPYLTSNTHSLLAEYILSTGDMAQAERHAQIAVKQSAGVPFPFSLVSAEKTLYEIALLRNDNLAALKHYKNYAEADKAYLNDVKARELAYQLARHETLQKTQTIALLNKKNRVLELEQTVAQQKAHYTAIFLGLLAALLALIIFWAYRTKRMQIAFRRLAETDTLTGISNRDHFTKNVEHALIEACKKSEQIAMIMFDLDNFKSINDRYGHSTGDWVLKRAIEVIKPLCRKQDCLGRIGGEEFAILLRASDLESAALMADRFRECIAGINTNGTGHSFTATASFGVTTTLLSGYVFDTLMCQADEALYQSKREGRNRVSSYNNLKSDADIVAEAAIGL